MLFVTRAPGALSHVKAAVAPVLPGVGSAHLSEALAAACGCRTHASWLAAGPVVVRLDDDAFRQRLEQLGHAAKEWPGFDSLETAWLSPEYAGLRRRAWRNLLVAGINAGIAGGILSLDPIDTAWERGRERGASVCYDVALPGELPARASIRDAGYGEVSVNVAVFPTSDDRISDWNAGFQGGQAFAAGWLERKAGAWLQDPTKQLDLHVGRELLRPIASWNLVPLGFRDFGRFMM